MKLSDISALLGDILSKPRTKEAVLAELNLLKAGVDAEVQRVRDRQRNAGLNGSAKRWGAKNA